MYPTTDADRTILADELTARGFRPTQSKPHFDRAKIAAMAAAMQQGTFDWHAAGLQPVILGPNDEVLGGHHRVVVAAHLARIDLLAVPGPRPQVQRLPICYREVSAWIDVLPEC